METKNYNYNSVNIRFLAKTSDIRNLSQNIRSDIKTSEVVTLHTAKKWNTFGRLKSVWHIALPSIWTQKYGQPGSKQDKKEQKLLDEMYSVINHILH